MGGLPQPISTKPLTMQAAHRPSRRRLGASPGLPCVMTDRGCWCLAFKGFSAGQITEKTDFLRPVPTTPCDSDAIAAKAASAGDSVVLVPASAAAADWATGR